MDIQLKKAAVDFMRNRNWDTFMGLVDSGVDLVSEVDGKRYVYLSDMVCYS